MSKSIGIIGVGNMGTAIFECLKLQKKYRVLITDRNKDKIRKIGALKNYRNSDALVSQCQIIILAVKPQSVSALSAQINSNLADKLLISIMAGVTVSNISKLFQAKRVIRAMPNLPIKVQSGAIAWVASRRTSSQDKTIAKFIFNQWGRAVELSKEALLDVVTAISGSGPAYFYYFCELLEAIGVELGLSASVAAQLVAQTFLGSAALLQNSKMKPADLKLAVTSARGTTAAALATWEKCHLKNSFRRAVIAAHQRARELGEKSCHSRPRLHEGKLRRESAFT